MNSELIAVGTELLMGQIANTNAQFITERLSSMGIDVHFHTVVGDNKERLLRTLETAFSRADCVILTGGLGPTYDDFTKEVVSSYFKLSMIEDMSALSSIEDYFKKKGHSMTESNKKQALLPKGSTPLYNLWGTAPGCIIEHEGKIAILLPGPPYEMKSMFNHYIIPFLKSKTDSVTHSLYLRLFGLGESEAENKISHLTTSKNPSIATYALTGEVIFRITANAERLDKAKAMVYNLKEKLYSIFGDNIYSEDLDTTLPKCVLSILKEKRKTLSIAESCTGGMVSSAITDLEGASEVFLYGAVTYANSAKINALGVSKETLECFGAVSEETAIQMARGVRDKSKSDIGVSTTGIAGPGGGTDEKPVGTVYVAISTEKTEKALKLFIPGDREKVRKTTLLHVYDLIRKTLK